VQHTGSGLSKHGVIHFVQAPYASFGAVLSQYAGPQFTHWTACVIFGVTTIPIKKANKTEVIIKNNLILSRILSNKYKSI
jgi:hypothetical protein